MRFRTGASQTRLLLTFPEVPGEGRGGGVFRSVVRDCAPLAPALTPLEPRFLFATAPAPSPSLQTDPTVHVVIDYSLDTNSFFDTQPKRDLLQQAADLVANWFRDDLMAITPGGGDSWDAVIDHPATGLSHTIPNRTIAANEVLLFAGGRDMTDALGRGGPGGFQSRGSPSWSDRIRYRGQPPSGDLGPWGGSITFDTNPSSPWHFGTDASGLGGANDFLSVAAHEVAHLFGFGTSESWNVLTTGGRFTGPAATTLFDDTGSPTLDPDDAHWSDGLRDGGREVAMDPQITVGTRRLPTPLDLAALDDIGWTMPPRARPALASVTQPSTAGHELVVTFSHYAAIDGATVNQPGDVYAIAPGGVVVPVTFSRVAFADNGATVDVTYALSPPGGAWDSGDNGTWSLVLENNAVSSTTGEAVAGGTLGTFAVDVADAPVGVLQPVANPAPGPGAHTIVVVYSDAIAVDPASFEVNDIEVIDPDGAPMTVLAATADSATPGTPRIATYTLAPRGGAWGPEDDGDYTVRLRAGEVRDTSGNVSAEAVVGTFELTLGVVTFEARRPAVYTDASGDLVRVTLKGPGAGRVRFDSNRPADAIAIEVDGTTTKSSLTVKSGPAGTPMGSILINGSIKSLIAKTLDLGGDLAATGSIGSLRLRNASGGAISAASLGKVKVERLVADLLASGAIGTVTAGHIGYAHIFAGVRPFLSTDLPVSLDDFVNPAASIRRIVAKTSDGTFIAAPTIGKVSVGFIYSAGNGIAADRVGFFSGRPADKIPPIRLRKLETPGSASHHWVDFRIF